MSKPLSLPVSETDRLPLAEILGICRDHAEKRELAETALRMLTTYCEHEPDIWRKQEAGVFVAEWFYLLANLKASYSLLSAYEDALIELEPITKRTQTA